MRFPIVFFTLFLTCFALQAQDTINKTDPEGKKDGYWVKKDKDGKKIFEGRFSHGVPCGEFRYFYPGGELKAVSLLTDNGKRSKTVTYYKNGYKNAEGIFVDEKKDSTWKFYSEYDKVLLSEENYKNGKKEGVSKTFYPEGDIAEMTNWKDGVRTGAWEQYFKDGKLKLKCTYVDDQKDGPFRTYYTSGKIRVNGQYIKGITDGTWLYISEKGEVEKKEYYKKGLLIKTEDLKKQETK